MIWFFLAALLVLDALVLGVTCPAAESCLSAWWWLLWVPLLVILGVAVIVSLGALGCVLLGFGGEYLEDGWRWLKDSARRLKW